jgi:hypothetical protein
METLALFNALGIKCIIAVNKKAVFSNDSTAET